MRTVYLDEQFRCFVSDDGTRLPVETEAFDGKCDAFVEGYRFIPAGKCWMRSDGTLFCGEMSAPLGCYAALDAAQREYEQEKIADYEAMIDALYEEVC